LPVSPEDAPVLAVEHVLYHYCIGRLDVPIGDLCAQLIHAAGESSPGNLPPETRAVALGARSEFELLKLEQKLKKKNIPHVAIREPDEPFCGQLMAIGIAPCDRSLVKKEVSNFPLLK
jgi:hypothetical protein